MNRLAIALASIRREAAHGWGHALSWFYWRFVLRFLRKRWPHRPTPEAADLLRPITVVIPAVDKDADVLEHCLRSVRRFILQPITELWIVCPESPRIQALAEAHRARVMPEDAILPKPARELKTRGWVLQQFIKLNAAHHVPTPDYLVLDADTVFLRPQLFVRKSKTILRYSDQYELLYNRSLELAFGTKRRFPVSFVTHHMMFNRERVQALLTFLTERFKRPWWEAILHEVDKGHPISFAEYELYGHFILRDPKWRKSFQLEYWNGLDLDGADLARFNTLRAEANPRINSLSFHRHTQ
ncbi:MAG TPA: DUF6492 family protein [Kiritimatiellia bacterium]|nr:DUF6492 family protein [Kiritimatiellia bacterium]